MSVAVEDRTTHAAGALQLMVQHVGDRRISDCAFDAAQEPFNSVPTATWLELKENGFVQRLHHSTHYTLTGEGWLRALRESGAMREKAFHRRCGDLIAAIKKQVKRAQSGRLVSPQTLARDCGVSADWIYNAVESNLIESEFNRHGITWANGFEGQMIHVPAAFGRELQLSPKT
jgi:hypothetical protein